MISYTGAGLAGRVLLLTRPNDIEIYIEDTCCCIVDAYTELLRRILGDSYRLKNVFPLGGKNAVLKHYSEHISKKDKPRLYIIDGDIDLLIGSEIKSGEGLFVLDRYCIENYLICEESIHEFIKDECVQKVCAASDMAGRPDWLKQNCKLLKSLFIEYGIAISLKLGVETVSVPVRSLCNCETKYHLSREKTESRIQSLRDQCIAKVGIEDYIREKERILGRLSQNDCFVRKYVSAKDYIAPLLMGYLRECCKAKFSDPSFYARLGRYTPINEMQKLKNYIASPTP